MSSVIYRADELDFAWEREATEKSAPATINNTLGIVKGGIILPEMEPAWEAFFGVGVGNRMRVNIHRGPEAFVGSIPEILVAHDASRDILEMCLGDLSRTIAEEKAANATITYTATTMVDTAEDFSAPNRKDGNFAVYAGSSVGFIGAGAGITTLNVFPTAARTGTQGWNGPIPVGLAAGDGYEIRQDESVGVAAGDKFIVPMQTMHTMTWAVSFRGGGGQANMLTNYLGGKVNRWTLSAREGEPLKLALDEVIFQDLTHDVALPSTSVPKYSAGTVAPIMVQVTEEPLYYSMGTMSLFELTNTFARIRSFTLRVDNQLTAERYLNKATVAGATTVDQTVSEVNEGRQLITLEMEAIVDQRQYFEHLMRQGRNDALSAKTGFDVMLRFDLDEPVTESLFVQLPASQNPVMISETGREVDGSTNLAGTANIGCVIRSAPRNIPPETESLIMVPMSLDCPSAVFRFDDA